VSDTAKVVALSGGVGGAKLALGLSHILDGPELLIVANTGDDFDHHGLRICPDLDTLLYTLSGLNDQERGWGRSEETWTFMSALKELGGFDWFNLGDGDVALHVLRSERLRTGNSLSQVMAGLFRQVGIAARIVPMSDQAVPTIVHTERGDLAFQQYFVRERCEPAVKGFTFAGAHQAQPQPDFMAALANPALTTVVITPSNPFVSIDPILALPGVRKAVADSRAPVVAVSPIVGGQAIKGPAAKMFAELGFKASALEVARHYGNLLDGIVIDEADRPAATAIEALGVRVLVTGTVMQSLEDRKRLAREVLAFAGDLSTPG
jgi:LPPG:FO 2-phospho-L-lactate transferase